MEIADRYGIPVVEDAAEEFGSKFNGQVLGTFGKYGVLSFNGNKMITTSGGGALITENEDEWREIMVPKEDVLQFVGQTLQHEQQNKAMNNFIVVLVDKLYKSRIYMLLLKGQGIAQC